MPRRNSRAATRRLKTTLRAKGYPPPPVAAPPRSRSVSRPAVDDIVVPAGRCGRKLRFATEAEAARALKQARANHARRGVNAEKRYYFCKRCDGFHLTSKEYRPHVAS